MDNTILKSPRLLAMVVLALAVAYLVQIVPHAHHHAHHHDHHHHGHHAHDCDADDGDHEHSGPHQHRHIVFQHLDFHFLRNVVVVTSPGQSACAILVTASPTLAIDPTTDLVAAAGAAPVPDDPLLLHAPLRAPPA